MNHPPLFIALTNSETGETEDVLISRIHKIREFTDTQNLRSGTIITTFMDFGMMTPQGATFGFLEMAVREKKPTIYKKIKKVIKQYQKMMLNNSEEFTSVDDEDQWNLFA